ncbi:alpha,alpha-trehalose-phosphate synthase (UDP-forming) [Dermacoccus nishinomiyaensis]|uniref:alpha,alpha-trehalose-phosphate synthase (UDP-forming) n=1 Tax=Dermacoccus nishinomiyaensis TaxID=1274 RepID=UPI0033B3783B
MSETYDFVVAANRLPVDRVTTPDGESQWRRSPGGLVTAMDAVMRGRDGAWVGWAGEPGEAPEPFDDGGMHLHPVALSEQEVADYYEGHSNDTLWPVYHDVIITPTFRRSWRSVYRRVNRRFANACAEVAAQGATVWVHDYQLQLVPEMLHEMRPDLRIGWFNHIPFPAVELFAQLPGREEILEGLLGADFLGFQRTEDAGNFLRAVRQYLDLDVTGDVVDLGERQVRAAAVPISIDVEGLREIVESDSVQARAREIREQLGNPEKILLGVDRLDYTKGIRHRLKAFGELLADERLDPSKHKLIQVATPSRERVKAYMDLRDQIELTVGRINGDFSSIGATALTYLHRSFDREEMAAMFAAADIMLVTPLRDGMNLVAKEYVTCCADDGALVLSEFTGAATELSDAYLCNPHDIAGLKQQIMKAVDAPAPQRRQRMDSMRALVSENSVQQWAKNYLASLEAAPKAPSTQAAS